MKVYTENCPCKGCTERNATCHAKCDKYAHWQHSGAEVRNSNWYSAAKQKSYDKDHRTKVRKRGR